MNKQIHRLLVSVFSILLVAVSISAQASETATDKSASVEKPKSVSHRPTKEQITEAQTKLKTAGTYSGETTGTANDDFRAAVKTYQGSNGLRRSGSLNRATLEKMGIALTDEQKGIPIPASSYTKPKTEKADEKPAATEASTTTDKPKRGPVFRATKEQINEAQQKLKAANMYAGEEIGKLDDATREGLKKFQEANGLKVTGTLNQITLEKMGIALTDKQKANAAAAVAEANK